MENTTQKALSTRIGRRSFLKMAAIAGAFGATSTFASASVTRPATEEEIKNPFPGSKLVKTICNSCSVGCGVIAEVQNGVWVRQEVAQDHPVSLGGHCCKGADMIDIVRSKVRVKHPMVKENGQWKRISWDTAYERISKKLNDLRKTDGPDSTMFLGSAKFCNEQAYYFRKFAAMYGTNNIDHQARICHSTTVAGVANTWGYGAMTNSLNDIQNSKAIIIFGANPAVNHPVGFRHFLLAKERNNAQLIVVDPRYTKTAAKADLYAQIRPGTDIPFMYGMLNIIFKNGWENKEYISDRVYGMDAIRKEAKKWTPDVVANVTGVPAEKLMQITRAYATRTPGTLVWAMGLTQHTIGSGNTRIAPILQLALGNMGIEGGGANILRGHDNVQGATDMCCLSNSLPGYYGLSDGSWKYFAKSWGVDYNWLKGQFKSKKMMNTKGFTLARWYEGVLGGKAGEDKIHNAGTKVKALIVMGNGLTSTALQAKVKEGLDNLELLVIADPFANDGVALTDKKDNVFLLPATSQFETSGCVTATNRSAQWRDQVVEPMYESKTDQDMMFEFAKRLGFYDQFTKGMLMKENKKSFKWPEDATDEFARIIKTIGFTGWTSKRLKRHQKNWDKFDQITLKGYGPMKGEYYGLPWPCWSETHSGSPVLYDIHRSVAEGGMGFRNRFGLEHNGVNQLAGKGSAPKDSANPDGYPEITAKNIEKVLGIKLTPAEKKAIGKNWKVDSSGIIAEKCMEKGIAPYGNARARAIVWNFPDQIPMHREPLHSPREDLVKKYPSYKDKANLYRVDTRYISEQMKENWSKKFPIVVTTGRLVNMNGAGIETRASKYLAAITPEMFCDINPNLAADNDIKDGEMMWIHSPEGTKIKVKAHYSYSVNEEVVFLPFHFAGYFQGEDRSSHYPPGTKPYAVGESANTVTNYGYDIITQMPETKSGLCRIEKA